MGSGRLEVIRPATLRDTPDIAGIIVACWQNAFFGIVDPEYPKTLKPETFIRRVQENLEQQREVLFVKTIEDRVVGFISGRQLDGYYDCETVGFYILQEYRKLKIGTALFLRLARHFWEDHRKRMILWTLLGAENNCFYTGMGGKDALRKTLTIGGKDYLGIGYGFDLATLSITRDTQSDPLREKPLEEMDRYELGRLFPILLCDHRPEWKGLYEAEKTHIEEAIGAETIFRINHIGSTAVPGLAAKPTIDVLLEIVPVADIERLIRQMKHHGFRYGPQPENPAPHILFKKGYSEHGFSGQAVHVHVRYPGDWGELYFRDYLRLYPLVANAYADLKRALWKRFEFDREAYTSAKGDFIESHTRSAREEFGQKYLP